MPYIIIVLALVFVGVGFTVFKSPYIPNELPNIVVSEDLPDSVEIVATGTTMVTEESPTKTEEASTPLEPPVKAPVAATTPTPTPAPTPVVKETPVVASNTYTNGTYDTNVSFRTPEDTYQMTVSMTVTSDKISATTVSFDSKGARDSYSKRFSSAYQSTVIGQDLGTVNVSRVGGASLTTRAFNNAISAIKTQAEA